MAATVLPQHMLMQQQMRHSTVTGIGTDAGSTGRGEQRHTTC